MWEVTKGVAWHTIIQRVAGKIEGKLKTGWHPVLLGEFYKMWEIKITSQIKAYWCFLASNNTQHFFEINI